MFKKLQSSQYVSESLWNDVKGLSAVIVLTIIIGVPVTLLIFRPFIFT